VTRLLTALIAAAIPIALAASPVLDTAGADAHAVHRHSYARRHHKHKRHHKGKRHHKPAHKVVKHTVHHAKHADTGPCTNTGLTPSPSNLEIIREATLCLVNRERVTRGESPLTVNDKLERAAQGHSESMASEDYFSHEGPDGSTPVTRMRAVGYISSHKVGYEVGENIEWGTLWLATPKAIVEGWMQSPGHRENILDPNYRDTGLGVSPRPPASLAEGQAGAIYTQDFGVIITR
jgi:uncharacterized protein YkwD